MLSTFRKKTHNMTNHTNKLVQFLSRLICLIMDYRDIQQKQTTPTDQARISFLPLRHSLMETNQTNVIKLNRIYIAFIQINVPILKWCTNYTSVKGESNTRVKWSCFGSLFFQLNLKQQIKKNITIKRK